MGRDPFDPDKLVSSKIKAPDESFKEARLERQGLTKNQWPSQIDRAALDLIYSDGHFTIGEADTIGDIGGTIDEENFDVATGTHYVTGLSELVGPDSSTASAIRQYEEAAIGDLAFNLNEFRVEFESEGNDDLDIDQALKAVVEKAATVAIDRSSRADRNVGAGLRDLREANSAVDLIVKLFSDPRIDAYADGLLTLVGDELGSSEQLLEFLDQPQMTTPLWKHQRQAIENWIDDDQDGYVDMATATGKTVLGLAAIAIRYGDLHPADDESDVEVATPSDPTVLVVAGNEVLLDQWRDEFQTHFDIPAARTEPTAAQRGADIELDWGTIEFRSAQALLRKSSFSKYDLVILDEAHRYTRRGSDSSTGWGDLFANLVNQSNALLAMSGSVDGGWQGDDAAREALEEHLERVHRFTVPEARAAGVIADFDWEVRYALTTEADAEKLATQTERITDGFDSAGAALRAEKLGVADDDLSEHGPFKTYSQLRAFVQSNAGNDLREQSEEFDLFASALLTRRPVLWNLSPRESVVVDLVTRHAPEQKTIVLAQSYDQAAALRETLVTDNGYDEETTIALKGSDDERTAKIADFREASEGVLVGPGDLLGVGVDIPDAEIAIDVSRGGVNASLVQRIGRVLRNPTGDKEAYFYHVIPQAERAAAIDRHEDGRQFLQDAAAYQALGESFKRLPDYAVHSVSIGRTMADLEWTGETALRSFSDEEVQELAETTETVESLRELRAAIGRAKRENEEPGDTPVVVEFWDNTTETPSRRTETDEEDSNSADGSELDGDATGTEAGEGGDYEEVETAETAEEDDALFEERNELYEQYRLSIDPYRAAKAVAHNYLNSDVAVDESGDEITVSLDSSYEGTEFHEEIERWRRKSREIGKKTWNNDSDGEPGSLPQYRQHWPAPREEDGALLQPEVAEAIGIGYNDQDPIFFPRTDGELYELPLPDGRTIAVDEIKDPEKPGPTVDPDTTVELDAMLAIVVHDHVNSSDDVQSVAEFVQGATSELLKESVDGPTTSTGASMESVETMGVDLPEQQVRFVEAACMNGPYESTSHFVETAVRKQLDLHREDSDELLVDLPADLVAAVRARGGPETVRHVVEEAIESELVDDYVTDD